MATANGDMRGREAETLTRRLTVPAIDQILGDKIPILDHGFVRVIDYMGGDDAIVQAARVSYGTGTKSVSQDAALIRYLLKHRHTTPFEMCEIKLHVKLPIFVARQWIRHRTANVNEYSARYSILDREFYVPPVDQMGSQSQLNRQGTSADLSSAEAARAAGVLRDTSQEVYNRYLDLLNVSDSGEKIDADRNGLSRELARMTLSLNFYTQWYWKIDLHNLLHFLRLRTDSHAQREIREYADAILAIVQKWVPQAYEAFVDHELNGLSLSGGAVEVLKRALAGEKPNREGSGLSKRDWEELRRKLDF